MKTYIMALLTPALLLASCTSDEGVQPQSDKSPITFSTAYVGNNSRTDPSMTTDSLSAFDVYGMIVNNGTTGQLTTDPLSVTRASSSNDWTYSPLQYWIDGTTYYFAAVWPTTITYTQTLAAGSEGDGSYTQTMRAGSFANDGATDVIMAMPAGLLADGTMNPVTLTFSHLLSKVNLTFVNGFNSGSGVELWVENVTLSGACNKATALEVTGEKGDISINWTLDSSSTGTYTLRGMNTSYISSTGTACEDPVLLFPDSSTAKYTVAFTVTILQNGFYAEHYDLTATISGVEFKPGNAYNFTATLDQTNVADIPLKPIKFNLSSVTDWDQNDETLTTGNTTEN